MDHRLILLRHAKSAWPDGVDDLERPLSERGQQDAGAVGRVLAGVAVPDLVLCSPAQRTRQTWQRVLAALDRPADAAPPVTRFVPVIYGAGVPELLDLIRTVAPDTATTLLIGHEPTMSQTARELAGAGSLEEDLQRLRLKYPTAGMAVFRLPGEWAELRGGGAVLEQFLVPRG